MQKIPLTDPRAQRMAISTIVDRSELVEFATGKHSFILATTRKDGRPQMSLVTGTVTPDGEFLISSYPQRAKTNNVKNNPNVSVLVMGGAFNDAWIQVDGVAVALDMPEAGDGLVEYFRNISGEHPDWEEYRQAMQDQGKSIIRIDPTRWSPISTGGFPPEIFEDR